jgi:hypothetical protein
MITATLIVALLVGSVVAACDQSRALTQCLQADLSACKTAAIGDKPTECQCATTAQTCVNSADCAADASVLATLQLAFIGSACVLPESTALPAQGSTCSSTGASYCYATLTRCGGENMGSGYPQPAVCGMCLDNYVACVVKYQCAAVAQIKTQFNTAVRGFRCDAVDFDARVAAAIAVSTAPPASTTASVTKSSASSGAPLSLTAATTTATTVADTSTALRLAAVCVAPFVVVAAAIVV